MWRMYKKVSPWSGYDHWPFSGSEETEKENEKEEIADPFLQKFEVGFLIRYNYELGNS